MTIKKAYLDIVTYLKDNKYSKVETILPDIIKLCSAKRDKPDGSNYIKNADGEVTHLFCYYHKKWEDVTLAEFGKKNASPIGFYAICKEGISTQAKQQRVAKAANSELLDGVIDGSLNVSDLQKLRADIDTKRKVTVPRKDGHGTNEKPN